MPITLQTSIQGQDRSKEVSTGVNIESSAESKVLELEKFTSTNFKSTNNLKEFNVSNSAADIFSIVDPTIESLSIDKTTYGEIIFKFNLIDVSNIVDHFIIMCDFHGIKAPIGSIAKISNIDNYSFIDQETFQYPGTRSYSVVIVTKSSRIIELENFINYTIKTNAPQNLLSQQVNKEQNNNPGIRNDVETAGKSYTEKLTKNKRRRRGTTNTVENIVSNTSIVVE